LQSSSIIIMKHHQTHLQQSSSIISRLRIEYRGYVQLTREHAVTQTISFQTRRLGVRFNTALFPGGPPPSTERAQTGVRMRTGTCSFGKVWSAFSSIVVRVPLWSEFNC
jgi:hypothetical protein